MAKGAVAKKYIFDTLLKTFEDSFMYNNGKELRVNIDEEGNPVQIKITLTAAKEAVSPEGEVLKAAATASETTTPVSEPEPSKLVEPTEEEKQNVETLLKSLGLA